MKTTQKSAECTFFPAATVSGVTAGATGIYAAPPVLQLDKEDDQEKPSTPGLWSRMTGWASPYLGYADAANEKMEQADDIAGGVGGVVDMLGSESSDQVSLADGVGGEDDDSSMFGWLSKPFGYLSAANKIQEGDTQSLEGGGKLVSGVSDVAGRLAEDTGFEKWSGLPLKGPLDVVKGAGGMMEGAGKLKGYYHDKQKAEKLKSRLGAGEKEFYLRNAIDKNFVNEDDWGEGVEKMAMGGADLLATATGGIGGGAIKAGKAVYESGVGSSVMRGIGSWLAPGWVDSNAKHERNEKQAKSRQRLVKNYLIQHEVHLGKPENIVEMYKEAGPGSPVRKKILREVNMIRNAKDPQERSNKEKIKAMLKGVE